MHNDLTRSLHGWINSLGNKWGYRASKTWMTDNTLCKRPLFSCTVRLIEAKLHYRLLYTRFMITRCWSRSIHWSNFIHRALNHSCGCFNTLFTIKRENQQISPDKGKLLQYEKTSSRPRPSRSWATSPWKLAACAKFSPEIYFKLLAHFVNVLQSCATLLHCLQLPSTYKWNLLKMH